MGLVPGFNWRSRGDGPKMAELTAPTKKEFDMQATILTTKGELPLKDLRRQLIFEERPDTYAITVRYYLQDELVRQLAFPAPLDETDANGCTTIEVNGAHVYERVDALIKWTIFRETELDYSVVTEYRYPGSETIVKRSAHVICKEPTVIASAIAGALA
jgi:hypothetical protein